MDTFFTLMIAFCFGFLAYLLYTRQLKWLIGVVRNIVVGVAGILVFNFFFSGVAVGVNAVTAMIVGILGVPGFLLLYAAQILVN